jgi:hypothetical protein
MLMQVMLLLSPANRRRSCDLSSNLSVHRSRPPARLPLYAGNGGQGVPYQFELFHAAKTQLWARLSMRRYSTYSLFRRMFGVSVDYYVAVVRLARAWRKNPKTRHDGLSLASQTSRHHLSSTSSADSRPGSCPRKLKQKKNKNTCYTHLHQFQFFNQTQTPLYRSQPPTL